MPFVKTQMATWLKGVGILHLASSAKFPACIARREPLSAHNPLCFPFSFHLRDHNMTKTCWTRQFGVKSISFKGTICQCWWFSQQLSYWCKKNVFYTRKSCQRASGLEMEDTRGMARPLLFGDNVQVCIITPQKNCRWKIAWRVGRDRNEKCTGSSRLSIFSWCNGLEDLL